MSLLDKLDKFKKKVVQEEISPELKKIQKKVKISERLIEIEKLPSRFLSGICAILDVKGYGDMRKKKLLDTLIDIFNNERGKISK